MHDANICARTRAQCLYIIFQLFECITSRQFLALRSSCVQYTHVFMGILYCESQFCW